MNGMKKLAKMVVFWLAAVLVFGSSLAEDGYIVQSIKKNGYIEQSIKKNAGTIHNNLVTDWSKLKPLQEASEGELSIFLCMIAAQMLDPGMTWEDYFKYLGKKGIAFELQELEGTFTLEGGESTCILHFSPKISLVLIGNPISGAWISMETPFEVGGTADVPVDIEHTMTPYTALTNDGRIIDETEGGSQVMP